MDSILQIPSSDSTAGDARATVGSSESHVHRQLAIQRRNLLTICRMCVKSLVDKASFESCITDSCPHLQNFCVVMEAILLHRIQVRWSFFGGAEPPHFWQAITRLTPSVSVSSVLDMEDILTDLGRGRAWLRIALVQKRLAHFMSSLLPRMDTLKTMYMEGAFMMSEELTELAGTLKCLDAIDFNLCLRGQNFDAGQKYEVCYFPYLTFHQSERGNIDDHIEEEKLKSPISETPLGTWTNPLSPRLGSPPLSPGGWEGGGKERNKGAVSPGDSPSKLREALKIEREQKNYFEELVGMRDTQLSRLHAEVESVSKKAETEKQLMENVVLELQQQIESLQEKLRAANWQLEKLQPHRQNSSDDTFAGTDSEPPLPPPSSSPASTTLVMGDVGTRGPWGFSSGPVDAYQAPQMASGQVVSAAGGEREGTNATSSPGKLASFLTSLLGD